ncbi:MAG: metallophosphoesterase family protein [Chloroflexota bacterium]
MRALVISDIHANLKALESVLEDAGKVDAVWCLGDVIGYGPEPNESVELLREQKNLICLLGNHDAASIGEMSVASFNIEAKQAVEWTQSVLSKENKEYLLERPLTSVNGEVTLAHGSPRQPVFEYVLDTRSAAENFDHFDNEFCFIGHSHLPLMFTLKPEDYICRLNFPEIDAITKLIPRTIINPGSVGQPRDRDPRASYAIFDTEDRTWHYRRVDYDIEGTQRLMREHNLPARHIDRLSGGW